VAAAAVLKPWGRTYVSHPNVVDPLTARCYGRVVTRRVAASGAGAVVAASDAPALAYCGVEVPVVYVDDSCFAGLDGYLPRYRGIPRAVAAAANHVQGRALRRADAVVFASQWAAEHALRAYRIEERKVHVVPFGANLWPDPARWDPLAARAAPSRDRCRVLFVGRSWVTKGGPLACATVAALRERGIAAELVACGRTPGDLPGNPWIRHLGPLDADRPEHRDRLAGLFREAHFLLVPALGESYGIALCEAAAFALPAVAARTGGSGAVVVDGLTGRRLPTGASAGDYADAIESLVDDPGAYRRMAAAARSRFEAELNWDVAGRRIVDIIGGLLDRPGHR
jgi:glycosyltransferase involved in cell wall biosynthesis